MLLLEACTSMPQIKGSPVPELNELHESIAAFYNAEIKQDWETYYSYFIEAQKEDISYEDFVGYMKGYEQRVSYKVIEIEHLADEEIILKKLRPLL